MGFFRTLYYFFSKYTDTRERQAGKFFARVSERDSQFAIEKQLAALLQKNIAVVNLWTEYRYKGYRYLKKATRRQLYQNLDAIFEDFELYAKTHAPHESEVLHRLAGAGADTAKLRPHMEKVLYFAAIMRYLSPHGGRYIYRESSSFGRLLRDPKKEQLEGDCNQIVTLYLALYAKKYDISEVKLTTFPGHVALHFHGVDIEATNGTFLLYSKEGQAHVPVQEIVSVNLLDTSDIHYKTTAINPEIFLEAARLAYVVSSHRKLVEKNLAVAYRNTVRFLMKNNSYKRALTYAKQSRDHELIENVAHNGAVAQAKQHEFSSARQFAGHALKKTELLRMIDQQEAFFLYNANRYEEAARLFERLGNHENVRRCYEALYVQEQQKLKGARTVADIRGYANEVRKMQQYARKSQNSSMVSHAESLARHL